MDIGMCRRQGNRCSPLHFAVRILLTCKTAFPILPSVKRKFLSRFILQATRSIIVNRIDVHAAIIREPTGPENRPPVFHCIWGKHRNGAGTAIILISVRRSIGDCAERLYPEQVDMTFHEAMLPVEPEYLDAACNGSIRKYGSKDSSLRRGRGISDGMINTFRNELLE